MVRTGVAARDWTFAVFRVVYAFAGRRPHVGHAVEEGAGEVFGRHA